MTIPIWKDTQYTASTTVEYELTAGGVTLAEGKLSPFPDGTARMYVNRLCEKYLSSSLESFEDSAYTDTNAAVEFELTSGGTVLGTWKFLNDWSYEDKGTGSRILSNPINGHMDGRMKLLFTEYNESSGTICYDIQ